MEVSKVILTLVIGLTGCIQYLLWTKHCMPRWKYRNEESPLSCTVSAKRKRHANRSSLQDGGALIQSKRKGGLWGRDYFHHDPGREGAETCPAGIQAPGLSTPPDWSTVVLSLSKVCSKIKQWCSYLFAMENERLNCWNSLKINGLCNAK